MRFSIVTISFNQRKYLARAIDSVLAQEGIELEYIVVDPGSTDGSRALIESYGSRISQTVFEPDRGGADGLNKGFAVATGEVFGFINSDDEFLPGALRRAAAELKRQPESDFVSGCGYFVDEQGARLQRVIPTRLTLSDYLHGSATVFQQGTFFRRHCFERAGGFNPDNRTSWDGELFLDFLRHGCRHSVIYHDLALFRIHSQSITGSGRLKEQYREDIERMFVKARGRARSPTDRWIGAAYRATKAIRHPRYALARIAGRP